MGPDMEARRARRFDESPAVLLVNAKEGPYPDVLALVAFNEARRFDRTRDRTEAWSSSS